MTICVCSDYTGASRLYKWQWLSKQWGLY